MDYKNNFLRITEDTLKHIRDSAKDHSSAYTHHHDFVRTNVRAYMGMSRAQIAAITNPTQEQMNCVCICHILFQCTYKELIHLLTPDIKKTLEEAVIPTCDSYIEELKQLTEHTQTNDTQTNPDGYWVMDKYSGLQYDEIAVAVDFSNFTNVAPPFFYHDSKQYKRGLMGDVPDSLSDQICSVRIYTLVQR